MIEDYFLQKRGNPMLLTPKEWSLIHEWYEAKIPQEVVLRAIDRAFERKVEDDKASLSLRYCRRLVKSEYKRHLKALEGKSPWTEGGKAAESKDIGQYLQKLVVLLSESSLQARKAGNKALGDFLVQSKEKFSAEILTPFLENSVTDLQRVEHQLTKLEKEIEQVLLPMISEEQLKLLKEDAMRELKTFEAKLDLSVYQEMVRRSLIKSVRKLYNIPRLSLFYM